MTPAHWRRLAVAALATALAAPAITAAVLDRAAAQNAATHAGEPDAKRRILHYRDPMGGPEISPVPRKDSMGMDFIPVYADEAPPRPAPTPAPAQPDAQRKLLYYRNPMGLPDTSPVPKKDPMGMDYIPVYEGEDGGGGSGAVTISADKVQKLGVRTEPVERRVVARAVRAVGTIQIDERKLHVVAPKFEAWIEKLHVDQTGQAVKRGQPLMEVYSPELYLAQQEYVVARNAGAGLGNASAEARAATERLAEGALQRLRNLDIPEEQIERLRKTGVAARTLLYRSPASGVVLEKQAIAGMRFMPGEQLYRIADLSNVWLVTEVFEQDLALIRIGQTAEVAINSAPGQTFSGKVSFIYPVLNAESRTARVRIELPNPDGLLRPALYATVNIEAAVSTASQLAVPESAVLDTGQRQVVLVELGEGRYAPKAVRVGARGDGFVQVLDGVSEGERVVVRANFLIDSESNLRAALGAFNGSQQQHKH